MGESKLSLIDENYWPNPLQQMASELPLQDPKILVAQIAHPWGLNSYRHIYTALVPPSMKETILKNPGGIGHEITSSGPHPSPSKGSFVYKPEFSIWSGGEASEGFEPLVVAWTTGNRTVLLPDQGFLMTYGLVPRTVKSELGDTIYWDDLQRPLYNVVIAKMVSNYNYKLKSEAEIRIDREYLQDYATIRNLTLVQVYYASNMGPMSEDDRKTLSGDDVRELKIPGRLIDIRLDSTCKDGIIAQVWGIRDFLDPRDSPVTEGRWEYGELEWPGIEGIVTKNIARQLSLKYVYVRDLVLQYYEEHPKEYSICPESGSVSYQNQWQVSYCHRLSRNIIQLEIKKLYEGCPPDVVKHWNDYAVNPPQGNLIEYIREPNVASRSKRIVYALSDLGLVLSEISYKVTGKDLAAKDFVGLDHGSLDYNGWWNNPSIASIARHIPLDLGEKEFLNRCLFLRSLVIDSINEGNLRRIIATRKVNEEKTKDLKSLKLLDILIQQVRIGVDTGLNFFKYAKEIEENRLEKTENLEHGQHLESPISLLFVLNDFRTAAAHPGKNINELLEKMGSDIHSTQAGFDLQLDKLYDLIAKALEDTTIILNEALAFGDGA